MVLFLNTVLLMDVAFLPFAASVLAQAFLHGEGERTAVALHGFTFELAAILFNVIWGTCVTIATCSRAASTLLARKPSVDASSWPWLGSAPEPFWVSLFPPLGVAVIAADGCQNPISPPKSPPKSSAPGMVCACGIAIVWLVVAPFAAVASLGSQAPSSDLGSILIGNHDVPPGFELDVKQSGPYEQPPIAPSWLSPLTQHAARLYGYDRVWFHRQEHRAIIAQVVEYPIDKLASADAYSAAQDFKSNALKEFTIAGVPYAQGFVVRYGTAIAAQSIFVDGPRTFSIAVLTRTTPSDADIALSSRLVTIQATKAPLGPTNLRDINKLSLAAETALGTLGAAIAYIGSVSLFAWLRDPLRQHSCRPTPHHKALPEATTVDLTAQARRRQRWAVAGLLVELAGAGIAVAGFLPFTWPLGLVFIAVGIAIGWIPRLVAATARRTANGSTLWTGRRRVHVTCYTALSTACILTGLLALVLYGLGAVLTSPGYDYNLRIVVIGVVLLAVGALLRRHAYRLAALEAHEALRRDRRPMVLYRGAGNGSQRYSPEQPWLATPSR